MPALYLSSADLPIYGVPTATAPQILAASTVVDAYLKRPEGLQWMPDYAGLPCYMAGLTPSLTLKLSGPLSPGTNVVVPLVGANVMSTFGSVGDVAIVDRASAKGGQTGVVEACVISAVTTTSITFASVANSHSTGATLEFGLVIREQKTLPAKRSVVRVGSWPLNRIHSVVGSYRYGRRKEQSAGAYDDVSMLALMQTFGGPPAWSPVNVTAGDFSSLTNEVWVPTGVLIAPFTDVRIYYVAGFSQDNIPAIIKQVAASAIIAKISTDGIGGGVKMARAGDTALSFFNNSVLDDDMRQQLEQFKARTYA